MSLCAGRLRILGEETQCPSNPAAVVALLGLSSAGCSLLAPTCLAQQERHYSEPETATIQAGEVIVLRRPYDSRGSQNDIGIDWSGRLDGTTLQAFVTRADCESGPEPEALFTSACRVLARGGSVGGVNIINMIVTHGRGNPEVLGNPPAFKIWLHGDPMRSTVYTLRQSSFHGPDC